MIGAYMSQKPQILPAQKGLEALFALLQGQGYQIIGPTLREQAIAYDVLESVNDLPAGWTDHQEAGHYRLTRRQDNAYFGYNVGPHSFKKFLHVPSQPLWNVSRVDGTLQFIPVETPVPKYAFLGVRSCEIHAMEKQDDVLMHNTAEDTHYTARRRDNLIIAVNCTQAGNTCFCTSMKTGPRADHGYDLALTELLDSERHDFLVESGSDTGDQILLKLPAQKAPKTDRVRVDTLLSETASSMGRKMPGGNLHDLLMNNLEHPRWDEVAERCLSCGNCTSACPTCFCTSTVDTSSLDGNTATRTREWDSCFNADFSYIHGGSVRQSTRSRYRQWMTHKLATWVDQFGSSGCVGCGRCITWCPVGIDITEEVRAIKKSEED